MKSDKHKDLLTRDAALARLLEEALESKRSGDAQNSACPDAEILAAYAEHGLEEQEASRWEIHIADCGRCQEIIAGVLSAENLETAELGERENVASAPVIRKPAERPGAREISRWPGLWRWWVPALGLATAMVLWFALRPALSTRPASSSAAATTPASPGSGQGNPSSPSTTPEETQMAQAKVPPPPGGISGATGTSAGALRDSEQPRANAAVDELKQGAKRGGLQNEGQSERQTEAPAAPALDAARAAGAAAAPAAKDAEQQTETADRKKESVVATGETPVIAAAPAPPLAPPSASQSAPPAAAPQQFSAANARALASNRMQALAKVTGSPIVFGPTDRSVLWRVGPGGFIENSSDQGQTWHAQASNVTADLLAGAAPSAKIAWAVGRGGVILRTEDGAHWQRVMPPALASDVAPADWIRIEASDELHATITSRDLHRYATADGGRTWVQQP